MADAETAQVIHAALSAAGVPGVHDHAEQSQDPRRDARHNLGSLDKNGPILRALDKLDKIGREKVIEYWSQSRQTRRR